MGEIKKLARQTLTYGVSSIVGKFVNVLMLPIYTAYLVSVSEFGIVSFLFTIAAFMNVIYTHGMETAFFNFSRHSAEEYPRIFKTASRSVFIVAVWFSSLGFLFAPLLAAYLGYEGKTLVLRLLFFILFLDALSAIPFAHLRKVNRASSYVVIRLIGIGVNVVLTLLMIPFATFLYEKGMLFINPSAYFIEAIFIANVVSSFVVWLVLIRETRIAQGAFDNTLHKKMLSYGLPLLIVGLAGIVNETLDRVLLKAILPATIADKEVGIYAAFYKISMVITLFIQSFRYAAEPFFFNKSNESNSRLVYAKVMDYFVWTCGFILMLTVVFQPWIAKLLIRDAAYYKDMRGMQIVPILLLANVFLGMYYNLTIWYKLSGKTQMGGVIASVGAVLTILGNMALIPKIGFVGSAITTMLVYFIMVCISFFYGNKYFPVPYSYIKIGLNILFLGVFVAWVYYLNPNWLGVMIATLLYGLLFIYFEKPQQFLKNKTPKSTRI